MSWMNIKPSENVENSYDIEYTVDHRIGNATVSEEMAQLLEAAKKAGI